MFRSICKLLSTLFYTGYFPVAPGTAGTVIALLVYFLLPNAIVGIDCFWTFPVLLTIPIVLITGEAEKDMKRDDKRIVLDEFLGYFFAVILLPRTIIIGISAFVLFRLFDILKPAPINKIQKLKGGWGIVLDDVMAGIYANLVIQIGYFIFLLTG